VRRPRPHPRVVAAAASVPPGHPALAGPAATASAGGSASPSSTAAADGGRADVSVAVLGGGGKSGSLSLAAARRAGATRLVGVVPTETEAAALKSAGLATEIAVAGAPVTRSRSPPRSASRST